MSFPDDFFDRGSESFINDDELKSKVKTCKEYVSAGQTYACLENIEETIQLCIEYDFTEDGLYLTDAVLAIAPYNSEIWQFKGIFSNNIFDFEEAYKCFNMALSLNPSDVETLINKSIAEDNLGMFDDAVLSLKSALALEPNNEEVIFSLGILYQRKEKYDYAIGYFRKAIAKDPNYSEAWYELGFCYENTDQLQKALKAYDRFLELEPYSSTGWYNRGIIFLRMEKFERAIDSFELSIAIRDDFASVWFNLGVAFANLNNLNEALTAFGNASLIDEYDETIWFNLGQVHEDMDNYSEAVICYTKALKLDNEFYEAYLALSYCYHLTGKINSSRKNFKRAIKYSYNTNLTTRKDPGTEANNLLLQSMIDDKIKALENDPHDLKAAFDLAEVYMRLGNFEEGLIAYNLCIDINPANYLPYYGKAKAYFLKENIQKGIENLKSAIELSSDTILQFENDFPGIYSSKIMEYFLK